MRQRGTRWLVLVLAAVLPAAAIVPARGQEAGKATEPAPQRTVVLDTTGFWRMHNTLAPPVVDSDGGPTPVLLDAAWLDTPTDGPPAGWQAPEFDDGDWLRATALGLCKTPYLARLCVRGRFEVTDAAKVADLRLALDFHGGAVVSLNGQELRRSHLPAEGPLDRALADGYPAEAFVTAGGKLLGRDEARRGNGAERAALRTRSIDVEIPRALLRRGVNVLALEVIRAPYHRLHHEVKVPDRQGKPRYGFQWQTCDVRRVQLTAASAEGLVSNAVRPKGLQVWNSNPLASDYDLDFGDRCEPLRPIRLVGARGGTYSGKVVVGCDEPIRDLKTAIGDLRADAGSIAASAVRIRYGIPWGEEYQLFPYSDQLPAYPRSTDLLGALAEAPLAEFPVRAKEASRSDLATANQPDPVFGAVVPVWTTVTVPPGTAPGTYKGQLTITARDHEPLTAPVEMEVVGWSLPATQDYRTWVELMQSPDTLVVQYKLEPWSERHWQMMSRAMRIIGETGSRVVHIPLIAETNLGNAESMLRWRPRGDGTYSPDFSLVERYLDTATENMGRPKIVVFWAWEIYLLHQEQVRSDHLWLKEATEARIDFRDKGPLVTVVDPKTGQTRTDHLPPLTDPRSKAIWKTVFDGLHRLMDKRGLRQTMMLGMLNDVRPTKEETAFFHELSPGTPWALHSHGSFRPGSKLHDIAPVGYQASVWSSHFASDPAQPAHGWQRADLFVEYNRSRDLSVLLPAAWHHLAETDIVGHQRGIGRIGADFWPVYKDRRGRLQAFVWTRFIQSSWRNLDLHAYLLAPGPDGPVATPRLEAFREGVQHCEARIAIERALLDEAARGRLGEKLVRRCEDVLAERARTMYRARAEIQMVDARLRYADTWRASSGVAGGTWFVGSGWQARSRELYALAGEVQRRLSVK